MAELYLVRHGQASLGTDNYDQLSALGEQQALWLGEYFAEREIHFDRCVIGTQFRHRQTADGIAQGMKYVFDYEEHSGLNEYDFDALFEALGPEHEALKKSVIDEKSFFKALKLTLKLWRENKLSGNVPELWQDFYSRVSTAMQFMKDTEARRVLVVSSGGPIGTMAGMVMKSPPDAGIELNLQIRNSSFSRYFFNKNALQLSSFNEIPHLDQSQRLSSITYG